MSNEEWTAAAIPDLTGRTAVVTGANTGLGLATARALAEHGAAIVLAVRDLEKGESARKEISDDGPKAEPVVQQLDLASLDSIRSAAEALLAAHERIDLLINNAGVMYTPLQRTDDEFEMQFGINHLGHFALTGLLLDRLLSTDGCRVVTVSSVGHKIRSAVDFDDLNSRHGYDRVAAYGRSKLANLTFTYELQRRLASAGASMFALAAHPGVSSTGLARNSPAPIRFAEKLLRPVTQSASMGALPTLRAATDPTATGGQYYGPGGIGELRGNPVVVTSSRRSHDQDLQRRLWTASEELTGVTYPV